MAPPSPWPFVLKSPIELNIWTIIFLTDSSISVGKVICLCLPHPGLFNPLLHLFSITIYPLLPLPLAPVETVFSKRHNSWLPTTWTGIALLTSPIIFPSSPAPTAPSLPPLLWALASAIDFAKMPSKACKFWLRSPQGHATNFYIGKLLIHLRSGPKGLLIYLRSGPKWVIDVF